jgi:hypothetical protein
MLLSEKQQVKSKSTRRMHATSPVARPAVDLLLLFLLLVPLLAACLGKSPLAATHNTSYNTTLASNNGPITYSTNPDDVLIRTFYGGGNLGTLDYSPVISIYGDGTFVLGPGLQMRQGRLATNALQQLLHTLEDSDALLNLSQQVFYDVPDQNATILELALNNKHVEFVYGSFGALHESAQAMNEYRRLEQALTSITRAIQGPTSPYNSRAMTLLVRQDFSPDLSQPLLNWSLKNFTLNQLAIYECGVVPQDQTGPNAATGCLLFTKPRHTYLPGGAELQSIKSLLNGHLQGEFIENNLYFSLALRPLLPDELSSRVVAILGSQELTYSGVTLYSGTLPQPPAAS